MIDEKNGKVLSIVSKYILCIQEDIIIQKELANTLKLIKKNGEKAFYECKNSQLLVY